MDVSSALGQPERVLGRYALYGALAAGGMATVHLGRLLGPVGFSRTVAIKRLHEQYATDPEFVSGFLDEARLAARIRHPNVVPTLDVVATEGQLFLVMEYIQGESLARLIRATMAGGNRIAPRIAVAIAVGALHGLHAAHEARTEKGEPLHIVHRDVSPHNIMVGVDGIPRVLDFGVAKAVGRLQSTRSGQLKGKVAYMSPEQLQSQTVDRRTDIFAMGVVLWETLACRRLFHGDNEGSVLTKVLLEPVEPLSKHVSVQPELEAIVMRALERNANARFATAREMALALEDCVSPATATQLGSWVESLAHDALAERATRVANIESSLSTTGQSKVLDEILQRPKPSSPEPLSEVGTSTQQSSISVATPAGVPSRKARGWVAPAAIGGALAIGIGGTALVMSRVHAPAQAPTAIPSPQTTATASVATVAVVASAAPTTSSPTMSSATSSAPAVLTPPPKHSPAAAPSTTSSAKKPDCTSPFTRDERGVKIYKPECLNE
jgi:serine/threonine-protein kinase